MYAFGTSLLETSLQNEAELGTKSTKQISKSPFDLVLMGLRRINIMQLKKFSYNRVNNSRQQTNYSKVNTTAVDSFLFYYI